MRKRNLKPRETKREQKNRMLKSKLRQLYQRLARLEKLLQNLKREIDEEAND